MPNFSISPVGPFPDPSSSQFPDYIQFQQDGTNLGDATVDTINFTDNITATRGVGENANVLTVSATGGGAAAIPWVGSFVDDTGTFLFDGVEHSAWTVTQASGLAASTDFNLTGNTLTVTQNGVYEVSVIASFLPQAGLWPSSPTAWAVLLANAEGPGYAVQGASNDSGTPWGFITPPPQHRDITATFTLLAAAGHEILPSVVANSYLNTGAPYNAEIYLTAKRIGDYTPP